MQRSEYMNIDCLLQSVRCLNETGRGRKDRKNVRSNA